MTNKISTEDQGIVDTVKSQLEQLAQEFEAHKTDFIECIETNPADALRRRATGMVKAQVTAELAAETLDMIERACGDAPEDMEGFFGDAEPPAREIERVLAALLATRRRITGNLLHRDIFTYNSSPADNMVDVAKVQAIADFVGSYRAGSLSFLVSMVESFLAAEAKEAPAAKVA